MRGQIKIELADNGFIVRDEDGGCTVIESDCTTVESISKKATEVVGREILRSWLDGEDGINVAVTVNFEIKEDRKK